MMKKKIAFQDSTNERKNLEKRLTDKRLISLAEPKTKLHEYNIFLTTRKDLPSKRGDGPLIRRTGASKFNRPNKCGR